MAKGHLSEDTINFIVTAESDQLQQEIHKSIMTGLTLFLKKLTKYLEVNLKKCNFAAVINAKP